MVSWINRLFSDENGAPSSTRVMNFIVIIVVMGNWTYCNITNGVFNPLDLGSVSAICGGFAFQSCNKFAERRTRFPSKPLPDVSPAEE